MKEVNELRQRKIFQQIFDEKWVEYYSNNPNGLILRNKTKSKLDEKKDSSSPKSYETDDSSYNLSKSC